MTAMSCTGAGRNQEQRVQAVGVEARGLRSDSNSNIGAEFSIFILSSTELLARMEIS